MGSRYKTSTVVVPEIEIYVWAVTKSLKLKDACSSTEATPCTHNNWPWVGEIVGESLLKHSTNLEAWAVARNLSVDGLNCVDYTAMCFTIFVSLEIIDSRSRGEDC